MNARRPSARRGFTLIEMIITLSVFLLLAGAVFGIFDATLQSAGALQDDQARADQAEAMSAWLKQSLLRLPANGVVITLRREGTPFDASDLIWGSPAQLDALDLHPQANGNYTLRFATMTPDAKATASAAQNDFSQRVLNDDASLSWRVLLRDLVQANWRFRSAGDSTWSDNSPGGRPLLVEFSYQVAGASPISTTDCWLPPLTPPGAPALTSNP